MKRYGVESSDPAMIPAGFLDQLRASARAAAEREAEPEGGPVPSLAEIMKRYGVESSDPAMIPAGFLDQLRASARAVAEREAEPEGGPVPSLAEIMKRYGVESSDPAMIPAEFLDQLRASARATAQREAEDKRVSSTAVAILHAMVSIDKWESGGYPDSGFLGSGRTVQGLDPEFCTPSLVSVSPNAVLSWESIPSPDGRLQR